MNSLHYANDRLSVGKRMICSACGSGKTDREARAAPWRRQTCASARSTAYCSQGISQQLPRGAVMFCSWWLHQNTEHAANSA